MKYINTLPAIGCMFVLMFFTPKAHSQYSFSPSTLLEKNQAYNLITYDSINIANLSADTLHLNWTLLNYDSISGTYLDFCSSGVCFLGYPANGSFPPILPGGYGYAGAHFWTGSTAATATAKIWVYPEGNFANGDTLTYLLHAQHGSGIDNTAAANIYISLWPNPATTVLYIEGTAANTPVEIFDATGRHSPVARLTSSQLNISALPAGLYFIKLNIAEESVVRKFVKK